MAGYSTGVACSEGPEAVPAGSEAEWLAAGFGTAWGSGKGCMLSRPGSADTSRPLVGRAIPPVQAAAERQIHPQKKASLSFVFIL